MATKKTKATKSNAKAATQKASTKKKGEAIDFAATCTEAIAHEEAGRWAEAAAAWAHIVPLCASKMGRKEAAGRAAAAKVRASAQSTKSAPLDEQLAESRTAEANAASWDQAMPEPGYTPPAGTDDEGASARDGGADDGGVDDDATAAAGAPTVEPGAPGAAPKKPGRAPGERDPRLPAVGTVIAKKDRQGNERARCTIVHDGVEYRGTTYRSISAAAMAAAKDLGLASKTQDGYAFFGLKKGSPRAARKDAVGSLEKAWERYRERVAVAAQIADDAERARVREAIHQHVTALLALAGEAAA
jgi:hypothetical protein